MTVPLPRRVHLVYPSSERISTPDTIGRHLTQLLADRYEVVQHDWAETRVIDPVAGDVLLGHPHPVPGTIFRRSARRPGWSRVLMLSPFHHGDLPQNAYIDRVIGLCDLYLAISGPYWFESLAFSPFAHWLPKMRRVDLAADRSEFPPAKQRFAPAGDRRFLYIGNAEPHKSPEYLSAIARRMPGGKISWIGPLTRPIAGVTPLGPHDFRDERARRLVAEYDFLVTVGRADANPTTVLEAMSWGLIPVCTPSSGYVGYDGILNVPVDDPDAAAATLMELDATSDEWLAGLQRDNWELLDSDFTWERFLRRVVDAIESDESPPLLRPPLSRSLRLRAAAARSVHAWARPRNLRHALRTLRSS